MDTEKMIGKLGQVGLHGRIASMVCRLAAEVEGIEQEWAGLGRVGGQREDHAAKLMMRLEPHLRDLAKLASTAREQIIAMHADPFCRSAKAS